MEYKLARVSRILTRPRIERRNFRGCMMGRPVWIS